MRKRTSLPQYAHLQRQDRGLQAKGKQRAWMVSTEQISGCPASTWSSKQKAPENPGPQKPTIKPSLTATALRFHLIVWLVFKAGQASPAILTIYLPSCGQIQNDTLVLSHAGGSEARAEQGHEKAVSPFSTPKSRPALKFLLPVIRGLARAAESREGKKG